VDLSRGIVPPFPPESWAFFLRIIFPPWLTIALLEVPDWSHRRIPIFPSLELSSASEFTA
jgi:hypothetical protein